MHRGNECYLFSTVSYNVQIRYNKDTLILPPFAKNIRISDDSKLGALPKGISKVIINQAKIPVENLSEVPEPKDSSKKRNKNKEDK